MRAVFLKQIKKTIIFFVKMGFLALFFVLPKISLASTLSISPVGGTFAVGSTFDVSVFLNTEGKSINAIETSISFPPDKLQLVSPSTGKSIIGFWTVQPNINNQTGKIDFQGGIPGGVNLSNGLITTLTFRVKSVGGAVLKFLDNSKILLNDGKGTNDLTNTNNGIYNLILPPPAGPIVTSDTHPDQTVWSSRNSLNLNWSSDSDVTGYSYILNQDPVDTPDDIVDSSKNNVFYRNLKDGIYYFHIKALRKNSGFGGVTHFSAKIDTTPPADFVIKVIPNSKTVRKQPIFEFTTTDADAGLDHYELKVIPLSKVDSKGSKALFIEVTSPFVSQELPLGDYDVLVRSYDKAGNFREVKQRLSIVNFAFEFIGGEGVSLTEKTVIPWSWVWTSIICILGILFYLSKKVRLWHRNIELLRQNKVLPDSLKEQMEELKKYKQKYGKLAILLLFLSSFYFSTHVVKAEDNSQEFAPPIIQTISSQISNEDIFYLGGKTEIATSQVIVRLQNTQTGEIFSSTIEADKKGEWFYRHDRFLPAGNYIVWVQGKAGGQSTAPSAQREIKVTSTAIQIGSSRLSHEAIYLSLFVVFVFAFFGLLVYMIFHYRMGKRKHAIFVKETEDLEESVRRGFAVIRRDIQLELEAVKIAKQKGEISEDILEKEMQIMKDLEELEGKLGKEIWDIEHVENF